MKEGLELAGLESVLVLAPHPDDESIGCGGTLRALTRAGVGCDVLLHESIDKVSAIVDLIKGGKYQRIFCPWVHDAHPDHAVTFRMLQLALQNIESSPEVWLYEVWSPLIANRVVPIDDTMGAKIKAISMYQDKHEPTDYVWRFLGLAKYRSLLARSSSFAEAFLALDKAMFLALPFPKPLFTHTIMQPAIIPERMIAKNTVASL